MTAPEVPPSLLFFAGACLAPLLPRRLRPPVRLLVPPLAFWVLLGLPEGRHAFLEVLGFTLCLLQVDRLSLCFGYVFVIIAFAGLLFGLHREGEAEPFWAMTYAGSALGVIFSGDLVSFYLFWELMAVSSTFLIWSHGTPGALRAGFRYLLVHLFGGALLLAGIILRIHGGGGLEFSGPLEGGLSGILIMTSFMLNAAVPPLHPWLPDAYPEASPTGAIYLTAYTTKASVYVLLRAFPGNEALIWFGAVMALYGVVWAILQDDMRRLLAYHIVSQVGYMVCGVGIGTALSMSGSAAHAFTHILYKALLFMGAGAVMYATGRRRMTNLYGTGLFWRMPYAFFMYMIGAFSISSVPLFSGFISKPMILEAALEGGHYIPYFLLHLASIGTWLCTAFKLPYYTFFGRGREGDLEAKPLPLGMRLGMAYLAFLCVFLGVHPLTLYRILPYPFEFSPYAPGHLLETLQMLAASGLTVWILMGLLRPHKGITLDTDWFYRKGAQAFLSFCGQIYALRERIRDLVGKVVEGLVRWVSNPLEVPRARRPYDPDRYCLPSAVGILLVVLAFVLLALLGRP